MEGVRAELKKGGIGDAPRDASPGQGVGNSCAGDIRR